jgi:hypothetical protein
MARFTDNEIKLLHHGIRWIGFRRPDRVRVKTLVRRFKCIFGKGPVAINALFNDCKNAMDGFDEKYAFATLNWLKTYAFETDLAGRYGCCERTVEDKTKVYTKLFASFKISKICSNTLQCIYFSQTNLLFYLNYLTVGGKRSKQIKGPHHYQGHASSTKIYITFAITNNLQPWDLHRPASNIVQSHLPTPNPTEHLSQPNSTIFVNIVIVKT